MEGGNAPHRSKLARVDWSFTTRADRLVRRWWSGDSNMVDIDVERQAGVKREGYDIGGHEGIQTDASEMI